MNLRMVENRYPATCATCGKSVLPGDGVCVANGVRRTRQGYFKKVRWITYCADHKPAGETTAQKEDFGAMPYRNEIGAISARVGYKPGELPDNISITNIRNDLRRFARIMGVDGVISSRLSAAELRAFYNAGLHERHDMISLFEKQYGNAASEPAAQKANGTANNTIVDTLFADEEPAPKPAPASVNGADSAARKLAEALAELTARQKTPLDEARVIELIREHSAAPVTVRHEIKIGDHIATVNDATHELFPEIVAAIAAGENVMLIGPAGSGKTHLARQVATALGLPFRFTGAVGQEYKLTGFIDAYGTYHRTAFRDAFENGGLFLFDEIDGSNPNVLLTFNAALANDSMDFPDGNIQKHPEFRCIAAANTYGNGADRQYVGRAQLDAASLDRFVRVFMDYDESLELTIAGDTDWTRHVQKVRRAVRDLKIRQIISPRSAIRGNRLLATGKWSWERVEAATVYAGLDADTIAKIKAAL